MKNGLNKFEFENGKDNHCKQKWTFDVLKTDHHLILDNLLIEEKLKTKGCLGHPKTIEVLLKGREINTLDLQALAQTECSMPISCGQFLCSCLESIKSNY